MEKMLFALSFGFALLLFALQPAHAAQCAPRDQVTAALASRFDESRRAIGLAGPEQVVELFASAAGSWTITVTRPDGMTCLVASGEGFETVQEELPAKGAPA